MKLHLAAATSAMVLCAAVLSASGEHGDQAAGSGVPTFAKDIAPILYKNCTGCHRPGEVAPMSLLTYDEVRPYAKEIRNKVVAGIMPPWHADRAHGKFANERGLSDREKAVIQRWANNGAPRGEAADLPPQPKYTDGWTLGRPDAVVSMPVDYKVPSDGFVEYEYFEIPTNFTEDKWVQSVEIRPGARDVVHHVIVTMRPPKPEARPAGFKFAEGMDIPRGETGSSDANGSHGRGQNLFPRPQRLGAFIGGFAPGTSPFTFEPGTAMMVRAGSTIVLQMHYTPSGKETTDRTKIGFIFAKQAPEREMRLGTLINGQFTIPAGASDHVVKAEMTTSADVTLRSLLPHTHLRGKSWEYTATYPDGRTDVLLSVPKYDFNWQTEYVFAQPLKLPKGTTIRAVAHYDNSAANKDNPDPAADVAWGDQTWEEMMFTAFVYSLDGVAPGTVLQQPTRGER